MVARRLLTALLIALAASGTFTYLLAKKLAKPRAASTTVQYLTAKRDVEAGEMLKAEDVKLTHWPASTPVAGALTGSSEAVGRAVLTPLVSGQPIVGKQLSAPGGLGLSGRIPEGFRAISLKSDQVVGVAGFLMPGMHIDVLVTYRSPATTDAVTSTVLQNAEVLAAGQKMQPDPDGKPSTVDVVTILVSPDQAERVVLASTQGTVHFVLRNGADRQELTPRPVNATALGLTSEMAQGKPQPSTEAHKQAKRVANTKMAAAKVPPPPTHYSVTMVRGDKETVDTF